MIYNAIKIQNISYVMLSSKAVIVQIFIPDCNPVYSTFWRCVQSLVCMFRSACNDVGGLSHSMLTNLRNFES